MMLVRIVAPDFVAGFETDGTVRRAAPIISYMLGWPNAKVREHVKAKGWSTSIIVSGWPRPGERWGLTPEERQKAFELAERPQSFAATRHASSRSPVPCGRARRGR